MIDETRFLVQVERGVRGWISFLFCLIALIPKTHAAFLVEFQGGRGQVQVHSILSANVEGIILRPHGGGFGNGVRHRWNEFTARSLKVIHSELLENPLFNQKSREVKLQIMKAIDVARRIQEPPVEPPSDLANPTHAPPSPPLRPMQATNAPTPPVVNPNTGIPQSPNTAKAVAAPTNSLPPPPQPGTNNAVAASNPAAPKSSFQLIEPAGVTPFPDRRPPASALSPEVIFNPAGIFLALIVMALSGYAGTQIARFKNRPVKMVGALSAALPVLGPAIFLVLPSQHSSVSTAGAMPGEDASQDVPGTTPPTPLPLPAPKKLRYEDDPDSPYANIRVGGMEETHYSEEQATSPAPTAKSLEHYFSSEYEFTPAFFSEYFAQFVGSASTTEEALILRTPSAEYSVHYISSVEDSGLQFVFASEGQWMEEFLTYSELTQVEVIGHA